MSEFDGSWQHPNNPAYNKSVKVSIKLKLDTIQKKKNDWDGKRTITTQVYRLTADIYVLALCAVQVTVQIGRVFGVSGRIEVTYSTEDKTAQGNFDFRSIDRDVVIMQPGQAVANLSIPVSGVWSLS